LTEVYAVPSVAYLLLHCYRWCCDCLYTLA